MYICNDIYYVISSYLNKEESLSARLISQQFNETVCNYKPIEMEIKKPTDLTEVNAVFKKINLHIIDPSLFSNNDIIPLVNLHSHWHRCRGSYSNSM